MSPARALMVQGVSSHAGKSLVTTALCRWLRRRGADVAPFKAQNMSNNARVAAGGEMGTAQWLQARAAGVEPDVRMNPVLLKPEGECGSQVVVNGVVDHAATRAPWPGRSERLWPHVEAAYRSLAADHEVLVIEGAGSPAETNLWADDIVNMRVAELAGAPVLLVADIDRGGAFAHLYGTWALLPPACQRRVEGFLLNKFRGDATLLAPAPADLEDRTGVPTVGVLPHLDHTLPHEEGPSAVLGAAGGPVVAVVAGPYASNLDELVPLQVAADVRFVRSPGRLGGADLVVLPGSKNVTADLAWLRAGGLDRDVVAAAGRGVPVLGICGGLQQLGLEVHDPAAGTGPVPGLGLLDVDTTYAPTKRTATTTIAFPDLGPPWGWLSGRAVRGYEIRQGTTTSRGRAGPVSGVGFVDGPVLGTYLHGLFEDDAALTAFTGRAAAGLEPTFERLADAIDAHLDRSWLLART
ncbi:MAG: cobyric acid synthase [Acidimicrobiales bacterium]